MQNGVPVLLLGGPRSPQNCVVVTVLMNLHTLTP